MNIWRILFFAALVVIVIVGIWVIGLYDNLHDVELDFRLERARVTNLLDLGNFLDTIQIPHDSLPDRNRENQWLYLDFDRYHILVGLPSLGGYRCDYRCRECRYYREERNRP